MKRENDARNRGPKYFTLLFSDFEVHSTYDTLLSSSATTKLEINLKINEYVKTHFKSNVTEN
jgi:hypothetical protein